MRPSLSLPRNGGMFVFLLAFALGGCLHLDGKLELECKDCKPCSAASGGKPGEICTGHPPSDTEKATFNCPGNDPNSNVCNARATCFGGTCKTVSDGTSCN